MVMKRPRFEILNEYPDPDPNDNDRNWWKVIWIVVALVALATFLYIGTHYWYGCDDWGIVKFCSVVKKPL